MARTYKSRFDKIVKAEAALADTDATDELTRRRLSGILRAMNMIEHRAAYHFGGGVGMLTLFHDSSCGITRYGMAAAIVTRDGTIVAEKHSVADYGQEPLKRMPCGESSTKCGAYVLPMSGDIQPIGVFTSVSERDNPYCIAYGFKEIVADAVQSHHSGVVDMPSDAERVVNTLVWDAEHRFAHPAIEELVSVALNP